MDPEFKNNLDQLKSQMQSAKQLQDEATSLKVAEPDSTIVDSALLSHQQQVCVCVCACLYMC